MAHGIAMRGCVAAAYGKDVVELSRELRPALMAFFLRRVHDHAEAEDLTQEVFSRIAAQPDVAMRSGSAYLFQVAANLLRDRARRQQVRRNYRETLGQIDGEAIELIDPFRVTAARGSIAMLRAALDELDPTTSAIFVLYRLEYMSKDVIAESFGISVRTVEKHLAKALARLTMRMGDAL
ncbi:RNA polymerase sigma factor [Sphingomonas sp.]|uniref:RNA polymerase sigma factor n=1 Tax=Sphingomonas sp. TaxID=28214 RepID=UPI002E103C83|nr:sigma-70 family RNA polymerase sigma factor [Sphingomonas sp.]